MADVSLDLIKKLTLIALVSDDVLMERLVLKGGNAIGLVGSCMAASFGSWHGLLYLLPLGCPEPSRAPE